MKPTTFLLLNAIVVTIVVVFFLQGKIRKRKPSKLNLRKTSFHPVDQLDISDEQELNVYFNFNGHMWDAYEIVGVPAGAPMADVEMAYIKCRMRLDEESKEILEMAYQAIHQKHGHNS